MSPGVRIRTIKPECFPRASGDEPPTAVLTPPSIAFSPRERG